MDAALEARVAAALDEDAAGADITTLATVPEGCGVRARLVAKQDGVMSGMAVFCSVFTRTDPRVSVSVRVRDGDPFRRGEVLAELAGPARGILTGERVALNFAQRLCGVATLTAAFVARVAGTSCGISDTRKTTPLWRDLEKAAVAHGGGRNHRASLAAAFLIKENHISAAGGIGPAIRRAQAYAPDRPVEVEVRDLAELREALAEQPDIILLDNMSAAAMREAVAVARAHPRPPERGALQIEASGNASLETVRGMAETGVDYVSVGMLTHSAPAVDLSLLIEPVNRAGS